MISADELQRVVSRQTFRDWQSDMIFQAKRHRSKSEDEIEQIRQGALRRQSALALAVNDGPASVRNFLLGQLKVADATELLKRFPQLPKPLTEGEMSPTTLQVDREVSRSLDEWGITPRLAGEPTFWALCHARWIGENMFPDGVARVFTDAGKASVDLEAQTRNFLRRTSGIPVERGNTSVITDCRLSAGWWRFRLSTEISVTAQREGSDLSLTDAHRVLQGSVIWETFVLNLIRKLAVLNAPRARAAVVLALYEQSQVSAGRSITRERLNQCMQRVAQLGECFSLGLVDWQRLVDTARSGIADG